MTVQVRVSDRAARDADEIFAWIAERSWDGALRWYDKYLASLRTLPEQAHHCPLAPEANSLGRELRQLKLKTRKGRLYRVLFVIVTETVHVVGLRGAGQADVTMDDLELPE